MIRAPLVLVSVVLLLAALGRPDSMQPRPSSPPCRGSADTGNAILASIRGHMANLDSTERAVLHLPAPPSSIELVADSATCAAAIAGYNAHVATWDSALITTTAYVVSAEPIYLVPTVPGVPGHAKVTVALDSAFTFLMGWEHPH